MVSDTISSPFRGAFHLSLMVLVHYRSSNVFSLPCIVQGDSRRISRVHAILEKKSKCFLCFEYGAFTVYGWAFRPILLQRERNLFCLHTYRKIFLATPIRHWPYEPSSYINTLNLRIQRLYMISTNRFGLFPFRSPLLRESIILSLPPGT